MVGYLAVHTVVAGRLLLREHGRPQVRRLFCNAVRIVDAVGRAKKPSG